ncbi:hypothetical protein LAUMK136_04806 [Mycobacterium attenuatum]|uniref:Uncharacterized protein n=1 Tax=Mycobacterium attenuatum TaxID=2341086 RepID=A0A498QGZ8_9MYCO|nr:hypothetical protein LAUMK136_04806 [Mycobacterium attenuatum]
MDAAVAGPRRPHRVGRHRAGPRARTASCQSGDSVLRYGVLSCNTPDSSAPKLPIPEIAACVNRFKMLAL